jgi:hypothetical protein
VEELVMRIDRRLILGGLILLATVAPLAFAGVVNMQRTRRAGELERERQLVADYSQRLEDAQWQQRAPVDAKAQQWYLLAGNEVTATLQELQSLVDASGVELQAAKASPSVNAGRQMFLLAGSGRPEQVCALLAGIEKCSRLIVVENGHFTPGADGAIAFEFGLATYHRGGDQ